MESNTTRKRPRAGLTQSAMRSLRLFTHNKEDSNSSAMEQSSKKETPLSTSAQPAYGTPTLMDQSLLSMKMNKCTASFASSESPHKIFNEFISLV